MNSTPSSTTTSSAPKGGILVGFAPWVLFTVLAEQVSLTAASAAALAAAIAVAAPGVLARKPKVIEISAIVAFVAFLAIALVASPTDADWITRYARAIAAGLLALVAFGSMLTSPFTEQYAREHVPEAYWSAPEFRAINRRLTAVWGFVFTGMVISHVIAGTINSTPGNIAFNWVVPIVLILQGLKRMTLAASDAPAPAPQVA
jgi:hypothetical protein